MNLKELIEKNDQNLKTHEVGLMMKVNTAYSKAVKAAEHEFRLEKIPEGLKLSSHQVNKILAKTMDAFEREFNVLVEPVRQSMEEFYDEGLSEAAQVLQLLEEQKLEKAIKAKVKVPIHLKTGTVMGYRYKGRDEQEKDQGGKQETEGESKVQVGQKINVTPSTQAQITAVGKDGVTTKDSRGNIHQILHENVKETPNKKPKGDWWEELQSAVADKATLKEGKKGKEGENKKIKEAIGSYIEMYKPKVAVKTILNSSFAKDPKFRTSTVDVVYRVVALSDKQIKEFESTGKFQLKGERQIIPYSESKEKADTAVSDFEHENKTKFCFAKKMKKEDLVLNFSKFAKHFNAYDVTEDEKELWMKPSEYYLEFNLKELEYREERERK